MCIAFQIDSGYASLTGRKAINEDFCGAMLPEAGFEDMGAVAAVADGVSTGGMGKEAAQTTVISLLRDYFCTPKNGMPPLFKVGSTVDGLTVTAPMIRTSAPCWHMKAGWQKTCGKPNEAHFICSMTATALLACDPNAIWKMGLGISLLFLPK